MPLREGLGDPEGRNNSMRQVDWHYDIRLRLNEAGDAFLVHAMRSAEERDGETVFTVEDSTRELRPYELNWLGTLARFLREKMLEEGRSLEQWMDESKQTLDDR